MLQTLLLIAFFFANIKLGHSSEEIKEKKGYVSVALDGQLGNQLFQIATAYAYALDHNLSLTIPDLIYKKHCNIPYNAKHLFLAKINTYDLPYFPLLSWREPSQNYLEIPKSNAVQLYGYFQSEKYFQHRRNELLELFAPPTGLVEEILKKYPFLTSDAQVVGVQIRDYRMERPSGEFHPTIGRNYYEKAMSLFPEETIFLISSNNPVFAQQCTEGLAKNIIYLQGKDYIEEFYTLVQCKSFISSNSSFGWWASWLSTYRNKIVIMPRPWFAPPYDSKTMEKDMYPFGCVIIDFEKNDEAPYFSVF
ncbi:MAG: alpha-1,2-fucosyltransferase [Rhabdochlamydiaceae bacterium]|nr:alpha-1,2-fucosyltransferase [Rhabdochlamydiaceae bacterium]